MQSTVRGAVVTTEIPAVRLNPILWILMFSCTLNFLDRQVINILAEPIKIEFRLSDAELGALAGLAFAAFHAALSLPVARLADRWDRAFVLAGSTIVWSLATIASGLTVTFGQLVAARIAVGAGEAGGIAPAHALIADAAPPERRARAIAFYSAGIPLGGLLGMVLGGFVLDAFGWRTAFVLAGLPGLLLGPLILLFVRDPRRATRSGPARSATPGLAMTLRQMAASRSFVLIVVAGALTMFCNFAQAAFLASFFFRAHGPELGELASGAGHVLGVAMGAAALLGLLLGLTKGFGGILGSLAGGALTDRLNSGDDRACASVPAVVAVLRIPVFAAALLVGSPALAFALLAAHAVLAGVGSIGGFTAVQGLVPANLRATAAAVYALGVNLVGLALGPLAVGLLSDHFASAGGLGPADGLRWSLIVVSSLVMIPVALLGWAAARSIGRDKVS